MGSYDNFQIYIAGSVDNGWELSREKYEASAFYRFLPKSSSLVILTKLYRAMI